jgi:hypothetical protein
MRRVLVLGMAVALAPGLALADVVFLHGGGRVEGEVVEQRPDRVVIDVPAGRISLPRTRIERMVVGSSSLAEYRARAARLAGRDIEGWLALAAWARDKELVTQSRGAYEHVLTLEPANATAHQALGHVFLAGRWITADEAYRAQGYVRFEGTWVRPEERQALIEERADDAAERRARIEADARLREAEARARTAEAEARRAEADASLAAEAADDGGIPYPFVFGGGFGGVVPVEVEPVEPPPPPPVVIIRETRPQRDGGHRRGGNSGQRSGGSSKPTSRGTAGGSRPGARSN